MAKKTTRPSKHHTLPVKSHRKPAPRHPPPRHVSRATRAKLSAARIAYARTGLTKAERELARAVAKVTRARAALTALQARAVRISSAAQKSRATWAAVRAIAAQERVPMSEARTLHKTRLAATHDAQHRRPRPTPVWTAREGTEEQAFGLAALVPELPGVLPHNVLAVAHVRLEHWPAGMGQGTVRTELVSVPFQTGHTYDEFWRNYHDALRVFTDAFIQAQGLADDRKTKSPTTTSYWIASMQAA